MKGLLHGSIQPRVTFIGWTFQVNGTWFKDTLVCGVRPFIGLGSQCASAKQETPALGQMSVPTHSRDVGLDLLLLGLSSKVSLHYPAEFS